MAGAQRGWPQFMLRVSPEMKKWIEDQANRNFASQNSEILRCIQERMDKFSAQEARRKVVAGSKASKTSPAATAATPRSNAASLSPEV